MSRSYKQHPIVKDNGKSKKVGKNLANKMVNTYIQRAVDGDMPMPQGSSYKKIYDSWKIADWTFRCTEQEWREKYYKYLNSPDDYEREYAARYTIDEWMQLWAKNYKNK